MVNPSNVCRNLLPRCSTQIAKAWWQEQKFHYAKWLIHRLGGLNNLGSRNNLSLFLKNPRVPDGRPAERACEAEDFRSTAAHAIFLCRTASMIGGDYRNEMLEQPCLEAKTLIPATNLRAGNASSRTRSPTVRPASFVALVSQQALSG